MKRTIVAMGIILNASAFAADGTITINGLIISSTCTLAENGGSVSGNGAVTVTLPTQVANTFSSTTTTAGKTPINLKIVDKNGSDACTSLDKVTSILLSATSDRYVSGSSSSLINKSSDASTKAPIYIQLLDGNGKALPFENTQSITANNGLSVNNKIGTVNLSAQYYSPTGTVDPQKVTATVDYTINYN